MVETLRKLRWVIYPTAFGLVFLFGAYCTFPKEVVREMAESAITGMALGIGPKNRGLPQVSMKDVSLWRFSCVQLDGLKIEWPGKLPLPPVIMEFENIKARLGIFSSLAGSRSVSSTLELYDGDVDIDVKIDKKTGLSLLYVDGSDVNLSKMTFLESALGASFKGIATIAIDMAAKSDMTKDGIGFIRVNLDNLVFGPGVINMPMGGFVSSLTVPALNLGKLAIDLSLDKGVFDSKAFSLTGGDLEADLKLTITLGKSPALSKVDGSGWFSVKREFVNSNETLKMLFDLIPELRAAEQGDGKVGIVIRGTLSRPIPRLERYTGSKAPTNKKDPVANK
jgi:type II secretion system protein N